MAPLASLRMRRHFLIALCIAQWAAGQDISSPVVSVNYVLGPGDQIALTIPALATDFTAKNFRIQGSGEVDLPVIGTLHAGGLTVDGLQREIKLRLRSILQSPDVTLTVTEFMSQPVSVLGAVMQPGIKQLQGYKSLFEVLSLAGGLRQDAGPAVEITRDLKFGPIPLPNSATNATGKFSVATIKLKNVMNASAENVQIMPGDTVFVPKAGVVYAVGWVNKPGGYTIGEDGVLSALQTVSLAGGVLRTAALDKAKILRFAPGAANNRIEIPVNIKQLMSGKTSDVPLEANDILFIPNSGGKSAGFRTIEAIVTAATGVAIYGSTRF